MDWNLLKTPETKFDWKLLKPPEEEKEGEKFDWATIKPPTPTGTAEPTEPIGGTITTLPPKSIQDIAKIMPKAEEPIPTMGAEFIPAKVISGLVEKPLAAMGEPISWALEKGFRALGLDRIADTQKEVTESYKNPPITKKVGQQTAYLRQEAYKKSSVKGQIFDVTEGVTQLISLLTQVAITKKLPGLQGKDIYSHFKVMAGHAVATTPGGLSERFQAAIYRMAYSMTPFIANWTGATGLTAVATDAALNIFLTSPSYQKAWKDAKNPEEFFQMAVPQLIMDIGMAWNTRGLPANQARVMQEKYLKLENRVIKMKGDEFNKISQDFIKRAETQEKLKPKILEAPKIDIKGEVKPEPKIPEVGAPKTISDKEISNIGNIVENKLKNMGIETEQIHFVGSEVTGKAKPTSDIDIYIVPKNKDLWKTQKEYNELIKRVKDALPDYKGRKLDIILEKDFEPRGWETKIIGEKIETSFKEQPIKTYKDKEASEKPVQDLARKPVKTKEEIAAAEKYGIPLDKVKFTKLPKADATGEPVSEATIAKLEEKWGKETEITKEKVLEKVEPTGKVSKIAKDIEIKAIEAGLTKGFGHLAEFTPITIKDQVQRAANLMTNIDEARSVIRGEKPLPEGLNSVALIKAMDIYARNTKNGELASELANSPLVSGTSAAAQTLRMAAEIDPLSPVKAITDVNKVLDEAAKKRLPGGILNKAKVDTTNKIKDEVKGEVKKVNTTQSWKTFIESIRCQ